ncbi:MAG TPA: carboxypeptidase regulatory-like domain-containing protein [Bryobacteraceae bacterium]|nr:carboxypeptidase regulatory-like domain-containing protein [Bryobacteraceae bacterium]
MVQDSTGSVIPNASITAVSEKTQSTATSTSDNSGHFVMATLRPGIYNLSVEAAGFRKAVLTGIELTVGAQVAEVIKLEVGSVSESVSVEANAAMVQTTESQISNAVNMKDIDILPQLNRSPITLAIFQPGVQIDVRAGQDSSFSHVNGLRQGSNNSSLDGIDVNDSSVPRLGLSLTANNSDSVEEFRVVTSSGTAEYGRNAGAQVNLVTRSGTNQYHGSAYDYLRNTDLNANDFFNNQSGSAVPQYIRNIYGGSFGGPIKHNKLFIFGNFQGTRTHQQTVRERTVPTATARQGLYEYMSGGALRTINIAGNDPAGIGIDKSVAALLNQYPLPNNFDVGDGLNTAGYRFNNPTPSLEDQFTIRGDYKVNDANSLFLRWSWQRNNSFDALNNADATFPGQIQGTQGGHRWGFSAGYTSTITPTLVNDFRAGYQSATVDFLRPNRPAGPALAFNSFTNIQYNSFTSGRNSPVKEFNDTMTKVWNKHTFKGGGSIRRTVQYGYNYSGVYPTYYTTPGNGATPAAPSGLTASQVTTYNNLYNDLLGRISQVNQTYYSDLQNYQPAGTPRVRNFILNESGYFFQDDWHVTSKLTLNLGLRWEYFGVPYESSGLQGAISSANLIDGVHQLDGLTISKSSQWYGKDWNNFAPRIGFAYDPAGNGKTVIRGFYGVFYDRPVGSTVSGVDGNTPGFATALSNYPDLSGADARYAQIPAAPGAPSSVTLTPADSRSTNIYLDNPNLRTGYVHSYSFSVQREVGKGLIAQLAYVGNRGVKLYMDEDKNQPKISSDFVTAFNQMQAYVANTATAVPSDNLFVRVYGSAANAAGKVGASNFTQGRVGTAINTLDVSNYAGLAAAGVSPFYFRNYPQFNQVIMGTNDGRSYYDSLQASLNGRFKGLQMSGNFTWSKSMDDISVEGNGFTTPINNYNIRQNRALSDFDRPFSFNFRGTYSLPFGKGRAYFNTMPKIVDEVLGGWDLGGLEIAQSGNPFAIYSTYSTVPVSGSPTPGFSYVNFSGASANIGNVTRTPTGVYYFTQAQAAEFSAPSAFSYGNTARNQFRNPPFFETDLSLSKSFHITERQAFSLRAEAYNLFNHPNFGFTSSSPTSSSANTNITTPSTFGKFSSTLGTQVGGSSSRTIQVVARYEF